jgi:hypothetical protein
VGGRISFFHHTADIFRQPMHHARFPGRHDNDDADTDRYTGDAHAKESYASASDYYCGRAGCAAFSAYHRRYLGRAGIGAAWRAHDSFLDI